MAACLKSTNIITVLEMVPYKLHSPDLQSAIHTINTKYNVQVCGNDDDDLHTGKNCSCPECMAGAFRSMLACSVCDMVRVDIMRSGQVLRH